MGRWERQFRRRHGIIPSVRMRKRQEVLGKLQALSKAFEMKASSEKSITSRFRSLGKRTLSSAFGNLFRRNGHKT